MYLGPKEMFSWCLRKRIEENMNQHGINVCTLLDRGMPSTFASLDAEEAPPFDD